MYTKILIPLDGSRTAEKVLPFARVLAGTLKIPIELLEVVDVSRVSAHIA
ncbi:MAG: universal stress protein, partial [Candidatus Binatia bacterium]